jgi:hypothetical protein
VTTIGGHNGKPKQVLTYISMPSHVYSSIEYPFYLLLIMAANFHLKINSYYICCLQHSTSFFVYDSILSILNIGSLTWVLTVLQKVSYMAERVVGTGSFGVVFQVWYWSSFCSITLYFTLMEIYNVVATFIDHI